MDGFGLYAVILAAVLVLFVVIFKAMWRVAEPNEALIISGWRHEAPDGVEQTLGFKIVTGKGTLVIPGVQTVRRLSLDLRQAELAIECVTHQGIPLGIRGVVIYKVGDDYASIANSARRFLDQQSEMDHRVHNLFAGHLRAIVGNMTVEEMIRDREKLTQLTRESSGVEMEKLGLIVDSLQIQEIDDPSGYITNLARPHAAAVQREARIAQAGADQEATQKEQEADALKAEARRDSLIKQAGYQAEVDQASRAVEAVRAAGRRHRPPAGRGRGDEGGRARGASARSSGFKRTVRKPADAKAYEQVTLSKAERDARVAQAEAKRQEVEQEATANAHRVKLDRAKRRPSTCASKRRPQAEATRAIGQPRPTHPGPRPRRGRGRPGEGHGRGGGDQGPRRRAGENQDAVIGQQLAEQWPAIVEAAAKPFGAIDQLIVLNGAQGVSETLAQALSQGVTGLKMARSLLKEGLSTNGADDAPAKEK